MKERKENKIKEKRTIENHIARDINLTCLSI